MRKVYFLIHNPPHFYFAPFSNLKVTISRKLVTDNDVTKPRFCYRGVESSRLLYADSNLKECYCSLFKEAIRYFQKTKEETPAHVPTTVLRIAVSLNISF